jgi:hypothetical protein
MHRCCVLRAANVVLRCQLKAHLTFQFYKQFVETFILYISAPLSAHRIIINAVFPPHVKRILYFLLGNFQLKCLQVFKPAAIWARFRFSRCRSVVPSFPSKPNVTVLFITTGLSRNSSVGTVAGYGLDGRGSILGRERKVISIA